MLCYITGMVRNPLQLKNRNNPSTPPGMRTNKFLHTKNRKLSLVVNIRLCHYNLDWMVNSEIFIQQQLNDHKSCIIWKSIPGSEF